MGDGGCAEARVKLVGWEKGDLIPAAEVTPVSRYSTSPNPSLSSHLRKKNLLRMLVKLVVYKYAKRPRRS